MAMRATKYSLRWLSQKDVMHRYGITQHTYKTYLTEMERSGRYPDGAIIKVTKNTLVLDAAIHDWMINMTSIRHQIEIPPYDGEAMRLELMRLAI